MELSGFNAHDKIEGREEWLTPPEIIKAVAQTREDGEEIPWPFDLDPCSPIKRPWETAKAHYTIEDNGLIKPWQGRVWCNKCNSFKGCTSESLVLNSTNETMLKVSEGKTSGLETLPATQGNGGRAEIQLPGLRAGKVKEPSGNSSKRPNTSGEAAGGKDSLSEKRQRTEQEADSIIHGQPQTAAASFESAVELDGKGLAEVQGSMGKPMRVLRSDRRTDARPLHSTDSGQLPRHSSKQHDSGVSEMQYEQATSFASCLAKRPTETCPDCGLPAFLVVKSPRVFCNPPYGPKTGEWMGRCSAHKNVTALIFARTETRQFFDYIWGKATAVCFLKGRLSFYHVNGTKGGTAGAPSMLVTWDDNNANALWDAVQHGRLSGCFVDLRGGNTAP